MRLESIKQRSSNLHRDRRRAQILKAATGVFAAKGFHQTRISDVIAAAGIARGTFYLYFDSKGELFLGLLRELLQDIAQQRGWGGHGTWRATVRGAAGRRDSPDFADGGRRSRPGDHHRARSR
jgi:AcrR family transcriptional regulator